MAKKKFSGDGSDAPRSVHVSVSLDPDSYDRLCYVADYFDWPANRVASNILSRAVQRVKFGDDLVFSEWRDPRRSENK